jgi:hypothetical protein
MNSGKPMWSAQTQRVILRSRAIFTKSLTCLIAAALMFSNSVLAQTATEIEAPITSLTSKQLEWQQSSIQNRILISEKIGEDGAKAFASMRGYEPLLNDADKAIRQGFDQVYRAKDGSIVVIEAKGGTSPIGRAYGCEQGTPEWAVRAAKHITENSKASVLEKETAKMVLDAAKNGNLTTLVVRTKHILGQPYAAVLESTMNAGEAESKLAKSILEEIKTASNPKPLPTTITRVPDKTVKPAPTTTSSNDKVSLDKIGTGGQALKTASKALPVIAVAYEGYQRVNESKNIEEQYSNGSISEQQREISHTKNVAGGLGGFTGAVYGVGAGAEGGAVIGSFFGPVGTAVGGFVGGVTGGVTGAIVGDKVVGEAAGYATSAIHSTGTTIKSGASSTVKWIGSWVGW